MRSLITENDIYEVQCRPVPLPLPDRLERNEWLVKFFDSSDRVVDSGIVTYSAELLLLAPLLQQDDDQAFYAVRSLRFRKPHLSGAKKYHWNPANYQELFTAPQLTEEQLDTEILRRVYRFFSKFPRLPLSRTVIEVSIDGDRPAIAARLNELHRQGLLSRKRRAADEFQYRPAIIANIRRWLGRTSVRGQQPGQVEDGPHIRFYLEAQPDLKRPESPASK
jgi:hypothetical protein